MLKIVGLWPEESKKQREELLSKLRLLLHAIILTVLLTIPSLMTLAKVWGDMELMIDNLQYTLPLLITTLKVFIIWYKKAVLSLLINMIIKDWMRIKPKEERRVMLKKAGITRLLTICGVLIIFSVWLIVIGCFLSGRNLGHVTNNTTLIETTFPIQAHYLHDISSNPNFDLIYLLQVIGLTLSGLTYTAVDNFLGLLILHICGQMENLHMRLLKLGKDPDFKTFLKHNVKDHIRLIRFIEVIDDTFNFMLLGLLSIFGILFCLHGFLIINVINQGYGLSIVQLIWYVFSSLCVLMHMGLYCGLGELLVTQSEKIHRATYEYEWYTLEPKAARNLTLIMFRAKKPLNITAGKTFPMTMSTFCNLLKTSAGYISVLLANRE